MIMPGLPFGFPESPLSLTYRGVQGSATNLTSYSFTGYDVGSEDPSRLVIAAVTGVSPDGAALAFSGATIGGVSATAAIISYLDAALPVAIYAAVVPTGTTATVVLTFTRSAGSASVSVYTLTGYRGVTAESTVSNAGVLSASASLGATVGAGVVAVACAGSSDGLGVVWSSPVIENYDQIVENRSRSGASVIAAGAATVTATVPLNNVNMAAASWR